jgi:hypothetical protein
VCFVRVVRALRLETNRPVSAVNEAEPLSEADAAALTTPIVTPGMFYLQWHTPA